MLKVPAWEYLKGQTYFPSVKENWGICHTPKCRTPEGIFSLLNFLLLEKLNLGDDPIKRSEIRFVHAVN